jgi:Fic family protein
MRRIIYIHQHRAWPAFTWNHEELHAQLGNIRNMQGRLMGRMEALGFSLREEAMLHTLTLDVLKSTEIEGELLNAEQVRSSVARRLGMDIAGMVPSDRHVDGVVEMMLDATQDYMRPLNKTRLCGWQASMFPGGWSGMYKIVTGNWRKDETGPMQVISGAMGKEKVHFEAPEASLLPEEMGSFMRWFNARQNLDPVLKAGIAHLWFITIHPFEDGNGRIARAITDMQLARTDQSNQRFYSMSAQIRKERKAYYEILERTQKGSLDITAWLEWFLQCLMKSIEATEETLAAVTFKAKFWEKHTRTPLNPRQQLMLNKLMDGFDGNLTSSKWAKITKSSPDTALRDIQDLVSKQILIKTPGGGRSTAYGIAP